MINLLRIVLCVLGTGIAAWQDGRTSFIDDRVLYAMVGAGLVLNAATLPFNAFLDSLLIPAVIGIAGYFLYRSGQFGAGDVYLFAGIALLLPFYPDWGSPFIVPDYLLVLPFVASVFIVASFTATVGSAWLYAWKLYKQAPGLLKQPKIALYAVLGLGGLAFLFWLGLPLLHLVLFFLLYDAAVFLLLYKQEITDKVIIKRLKPSEIEDEDILAIEKIPKKIVARFNLQRVLTKTEIAKLKRIRSMKTFPVHKDLPRFGPYVLLGLLVCLLVGDAIAFLLLH